MEWKKVSILTLSSAIAFGGMAPIANAAESVTTDSESIQFEQGDGTSNSSSSVEETEASVSIEELVSRIKEIFPEKFGSASEEDFRLEFTPYYPEEEQDIERFRVSYFPRSTNNPTHASFEFVGEDLELSHFYYNPENRSDALFPPKVSEEDAAKLAAAFIEEVNPSGSYELNEDANRYYHNRNLPLTEPIEYRFTFDKLKDGIPVQSQTASVTVLGNGEITQFNGPRQSGDEEYEAATGLLSKDVVLNQLKEDLAIELQYMIRLNYETRERTAYLTYREIPAVQGISAKDGKYKMNGEYVDEFSEEVEIKMLTADKKSADPITKDEAKELAKKLLETDEEGTTLHIEGVMERENPDGTEVYEIRYMYRTGNSGHGSSIEIKKDTGELLRFSASRNYNPNEEVDENVSMEEAVEIAVDYIESYAYTNMDEYAYPITSNNVIYGRSDRHYFSFPRVKDGLIVAGDSINVGISKEDGSLVSLNVNRSEVDEWPAVEDAVSKETALEAIKGNIDLKLYYVDERRNGKTDTETQTLQYKLNYLRDDNREPSFYNAVSGEWESSDPYGRQESPNEDIHISHPWAEEELNFMINNNIITVEDPETFNGDKILTKGEALEILSKSLTRIYQSPYAENREESPFTNIDSEHPLYDVIVRSVETGILSTDEGTFGVDENLTRENLSYWYIRALGLDAVAKRHEIFNYNFNDVNQISGKYRGYVVLAESLGLLTKNDENNFRPQNKITYAQIAIANLRLAKLITSEDFELIN
ncbi:PepSY1/2 domain-containing protein [Aquibacillus albus]|uniref:SLH domain-containing protein n=1 Tax=Aquibacillus albus TaxID=1168171 RepID=A0ABS2N0Q2_9BACI|nr:PepSY1/2 domain-containing protein [Aquibacillus albus]MBM7571485.1 hypothetical protein [Aquibacillus albus]